MGQIEQIKDIAANWCADAKKIVSDYYEQPVCRTRRQLVTTGLLLLFVGMVVGFVFSPIKKGISICSNNVDSFSSNEAHDNNQISKESKKKRR